MKAWRWIERSVLLAVHDMQLAEHGGSSGTRDITLFESALARPQNLAAYGDPDAAALAAAYGYGISRNHAFIDGNKRTALVAIALFLELNGHSFEAEDGDCVMAMLAVAAGDWTEDELAQWLRQHLVKKPT
jgi:death on curing protein